MRLFAANRHAWTVASLSLLMLTKLAFWQDDNDDLNGTTLTKKTTKQQSNTNTGNSFYPRINYTLRHNRTIKGTFLNPYPCRHSRRTPRSALPADMLKAVGAFLPQIQTDLHILFLGDSLAQQFMQALQEIVLLMEDKNETDDSSIVSRRRSDDALIAPLGGGTGAAMHLRIHGPFSNATRIASGPVPKENRKYWAVDEVQAALNESYIVTTNNNDDNNDNDKNIINRTIHHMDVVIWRLPYGHLTLEDFTTQMLTTSVTTLHNVFGASTTILINLPFSNNCYTEQQYQMLQEKRQLIRDFSNTWQQHSNSSNSGMKQVLVLDIDRLTDELYKWNARTMGYNTSADFQDWMLSHTLVKWRPKLPFVQNIAHLCGVRVPDNQHPRCVGNSITVDGMHLCMETLSGRIFSGLACLMACATNHDPPLSSERLQECAASCNEQFMSVSSSTWP